MTNHTDLKPCPFCGIDGAKLDHIRDRWYVRCYNCHAMNYDPYEPSIAREVYQHVLDISNSHPTHDSEKG